MNNDFFVDGDRPLSKMDKIEVAMRVMEELKTIEARRKEKIKKRLLNIFRFGVLLPFAIAGLGMVVLGIDPLINICNTFTLIVCFAVITLTIKYYE